MIWKYNNDYAYHKWLFTCSSAAKAEWLISFEYFRQDDTIWIERYKSNWRRFDNLSILPITLNAAHFPHFLHNGLYHPEMGTCAGANGTMVGKAVNNPFIYAYFKVLGRQRHRGWGRLVEEDTRRFCLCAAKPPNSSWINNRVRSVWWCGDINAFFRIASHMLA